MVLLFAPIKKAYTIRRALSQEFFVYFRDLQMKTLKGNSCRQGRGHITFQP